MKGKTNRAPKGKYVELLKTTGRRKLEVTIDKNIAVTPLVTQIKFLRLILSTRKVFKIKIIMPIKLYPTVVIPNNGIKGPLVTDDIEPLGAKDSTSFKTNGVSTIVEIRRVQIPRILVEIFDNPIFSLGNDNAKRRKKNVKNVTARMVKCRMVKE